MENVIICDISAWQYWRTPPILRAADIPLEIALAPADEGGLGMQRKDLVCRANARDIDRAIKNRLLSDLKGLTLPVHVMVPSNSNYRSSNVAKVHRAPDWLAPGSSASIGGGLAVISPALAILFKQRKGDPILQARALCEACGTYAIHHETNRTQLTLDRLLEQSQILRDNNDRREHMRYFEDENGKRSGFRNRNGQLLPWELSFDRHDTSTNLWRRPPLTSIEDAALLLEELGFQQGLATGRAALALAADGLASPLETQAYLLLCSSTERGGFEIDSPCINRRIPLTDSARRLYPARYCIADMLWKERGVILEIEGKAYHADRQGFAIQTGRSAALANMGLRVFNLTYEQMRDIDKLEAAVSPLLDALGLRRSSHTPKHRALRQNLIDRVFTR